MSVTIPTGTELRAKALDRVKGYVCKDRQATHGDAEDNFNTIARLWSAYKGAEFDALDVAAMMALVKVARMKTSSQHLDNWDDLAGYAICGAGIVEGKKLTEGPKSDPTPGWVCAECKQSYSANTVPGIRNHTKHSGERLICVSCIPTCRS